MCSSINLPSSPEKVVKIGVLYPLSNGIILPTHLGCGFWYIGASNSFNQMPKYFFHVLRFCFYLNGNFVIPRLFSITLVYYLFPLLTLPLQLYHVQKNIYLRHQILDTLGMNVQTKVKIQGFKFDPWCKRIEHTQMVCPCNVTNIGQSLMLVIYCLTLCSSLIQACLCLCKNLQQSRTQMVDTKRRIYVLFRSISLLNFSIIITILMLDFHFVFEFVCICLEFEVKCIIQSMAHCVKYIIRIGFLI